MIQLPQRRSLVTQLADILTEAVRDGRWGEWLPKERELARQYQVSRSTLRCALDVLREKGVLHTRHGIGTRVAQQPPSATPRVNASIGMLIPRALERFRYFATLVVDDLKTLLFDRGQQLLVHEHPQVEEHRPASLLARLVEQQRHVCWLLMGCGLETQRWFSRKGIPAVVSGTCDPAFGLPFVCLDNHALGRHAALTLLQHGHRRVGSLLTHTNPGLRSGIEHVLGSSSHPGVTLAAVEIYDSTRAVTRAIDRLMALAQRPTALFVAESSLYLAAFSRLTQLGLRIPGDVSMVCRDDEPYLSSLLPSPARYTKNPHTYAKLLLGHLARLIDHEVITQPGTYVMPEFLPGDSLRRL